jgi:PKD repeat protein
VLVNSDVGTVDNLTGKVKINTIKITGIPENDFTFDVTSGDYFFKFQAQTKGSAIGKGGNSILKIGSKNINVTRIVGR